MSSRALALWVCCCLIVLAVVQMAYYYPLLPARVASRFDLGGRPVGWGDKTTLLWIQAIGISIIVVCFFGLALLMHKIPVSMINMPNRDYWFAPERRSQTCWSICGKIFWMGNATLAFIIACEQIVINANLNPKWNQSTAFWAIVGSYVAFCLIWTVLFYYQYRIPREEQQI